MVLAQGNAVNLSETADNVRAGGSGKAAHVPSVFRVVLKLCTQNQEKHLFIYVPYFPESKIGTGSHINFGSKRCERIYFQGLSYFFIHLLMYKNYIYSWKKSTFIQLVMSPSSGTSS